GPFAGPSKVLVDTEEKAIAAVDRYAQLGYAQIKLYSSLDPKLVPPIVELAGPNARAADGRAGEEGPPARLRPHPERPDGGAGGARRLQRDPARQLPVPELPGRRRHAHAGPLLRGRRARRGARPQIREGEGVHRSPQGARHDARSDAQRVRGDVPVA